MKKLNVQSLFLQNGRKSCRKKKMRAYHGLEEIKVQILKMSLILGEQNVEYDHEKWKKTKKRSL